ncbi:F-box/kelch-repeat protein At3g06240-like [Henckelia pumila]|uniref:F-box/kelch-repeat protein At3g06240-like n=1 Tax=Henckelia pumila TaxID=405737 RepID=UPI003C6E495B
MADPPRLPTDVLIEVLIRLPVKSILKSRCVSKSWCELIRSPVFIQKHSKFERKQRVLLVKRYFPQQNGQGESFSFHDPNFPEVLVSPNLSIPILDDLNISSRKRSNISIHGPCNGLVCIAFGKTVFFCNPALREFKLLPLPRYPFGFIAVPLQYGFGFDPMTGAYKVIKISYMTHELPKFAEFLDGLGKSNIRFDLYNSASNSWTQIVAKVPNIIYLPGYELFYNGTIHWFAVMATNNYPCILCFGVSTDAFSLLHFHDDFDSPERYLRLMEYDDRLAVVGYSGYMPEPYKIEIWVMKEYGEKESWTKQFVAAGHYCVICPFLFLKNEELLVESYNGQLATCALNENKFKGFQLYGAPRTMSAVVYEESLISLNQIIASE